MNRYKNPRLTYSTRDLSYCAETGKEIEKGDLCLYVPQKKLVYHMSSKTVRYWQMNNQK